MGNKKQFVALLLCWILSGNAQAAVLDELDLSLAISDLNDPVVLGSLINYSVIVNNLGPNLSSGTLLELLLTGPAPGVFFGISSAPPNPCNILNLIAVCSLGEMPVGLAIAFDVQVQTTAVGILTLEGFVASNELDFEESNNFSTEQTAIVSPVPVPAAVWLFGSALIGLVGFSKRSKAA